MARATDASIPQQPGSVRPAGGPPHELAVAGLAHDLNNLLAALAGNLSLARLTPLTGPDRDALLDAGVRAAQQAHTLVRQLLAYVLGTPVPPAQPALMAPLVHDAIVLFLHGAPVTCECRVQPDLWPVALSESEVWQILSNLIINAREATPAGGRIAISAANVLVRCGAATDGRRVPLPDGAYVRLTVRDTGRGISRADLARIFDPSFTTKPGGHGLGLATVRAIVLQHGGHIHASSTTGQGTTFRVYLPALCAKAGAGTADSGPVAQAGGRARVLVVDDDRGLRELTRRMLVHLGYEGETAASDTEAAARLRAARQAGQSFAAVLLDLALPGGRDAEELVACLHEADAQVPIILTTGHSAHPAALSPRRYGFCAVLLKPYRLAELAKTLAQATGGATCRHP